MVRDGRRPRGQAELAAPEEPGEGHQGHGPGRRPVRWWLAALVLIGAGALFGVRPAHQQWFAPSERVNAWLVVASAIFIQALPFLVLGTLVSAAIAAFLPRLLVARMLPRRGVYSVPAAGLAGMLLPGCECASVPTARRLMQAGVPRAAALTFLLASPAINPVVLAATAFAYRGQPMMVLARFLASLIAASVVGWIWLRRWMPQPHSEETEQITNNRWPGLVDAFVHDFTEAAGWLVLGCVVAATVKTVVPAEWVSRVGANPVLEVLVVGLLAVLVALCSEADAFMAVSLTGFSPTAQLVFLVVGPMVDVKLMAMQFGSFGGRFVRVFAPVTFIVCVLVACGTGAWLLR